jgi:hypothetical protein
LTLAPNLLLGFLKRLFSQLFDQWITADHKEGGASCSVLLFGTFLLLCAVKSYVVNFNTSINTSIHQDMNTSIQCCHQDQDINTSVYQHINTETSTH